MYVWDKPGSIQPILYAAEPRKTAAAVAHHPEHFLQQINRVWSRFLIPEIVSVRDALEVIRHPREGACLHPFLKKTTNTHLNSGEAPSQRESTGPNNIFLPTPMLEKFSSSVPTGIPCIKIPEGLKRGKINPSIASNIENRLHQSLASATWKKHKSVWSIFNQFALAEKVEIVLPLSDQVILNFCSWCDAKRSLSASTIKSYIHSLSKIQQLQGFDAIPIGKVKLLSQFLLGVEHMPHKKSPRKKRQTISFPLLKILGHYLGESEFSGYVKQMVWTVFLTAFFGSLRMGEILAASVSYFDPNHSFLWKNVDFNADGTIRLKITSAKIIHKEADLVVLFPFKDPSLCPVHAFNTYRRLAIEKGVFDLNLPVFRKSNGENWTKIELNTLLPILMAKTGLLKEGELFSGHSFRSGIPSLLGALPDSAAVSALKEWGRWRSDAYRCYTKYHVSHKRIIFNQICDLLHA